MKKFFLLLLISSSFLSKSFAQKIFTEGTIKYKMDVSGVDDPNAAAMMQNMVLSVYVKDGKFSTEMDMGFIKQRTIQQDENKFVLLMDMMGNKYKVNMDKTQYENKNHKPKDGDYTVTMTNDTKVIAGYNCKKAIIKTKDGKSFFAYFTDEIKNESKDSYRSYYTKIPGMLMEYTFDQKGMTMTMTVISVDFTPVPADVFDIPATGYNDMTIDQLMKMGQ